MRQYREPTARNLLRKPLVLGVSLTGLLLLAGVTLGISILFGTTPYGNAIAVGTGTIGYVGLRILARFSKPGWEESLVFKIEQALAKKTTTASLEVTPFSQETLSPDTLDQADELLNKASLQERVLALNTGDELVLVSSNATDGALLSEVRASGTFVRKAGKLLAEITEELLAGSPRVYSLYQLPVSTDPLWISQLMSRLPTPTQAIV